MKSIDRILRFLISLFKTGGKTKNGKVIAKDLVYATKLKTIANWKYTDPGLYETWKIFPKKQQTSYLRQIKQGKMTTKQLEKQIRAYEDMIAPAKINFTVKYGIKFAVNELSAINTTTELLEKMINNKEFLAKYPKGFNMNLPTEFTVRSAVAWPLPTISTAPKGSIKMMFPGQETRQAKITVHILPYAEAKKLFPSVSKTYTAWTGSENTSTEIYLIWEKYTQKNFENWSDQLARIKETLEHEIAHIKDPSRVASPKLRAKYDSSAPMIDDPKIALSKKAAPNWKKNYFYHQWEVAAQLAPVLAKITNNTRIILRSVGKKKTLAALNQLSNWVASGTNHPILTGGEVISDTTARYILTGSHSKLFGDIENFFTHFKTENPAEYRKVINKLARQLESLKQQVKDTKNLTPESVIKLNTKLGFAK